MAGDDSLVALRDARERTIARLSDAFAQDLLELEVFEQRLTVAHHATSVAELDQLVADVSPVPSTVPGTALARANTALVPADHVRAHAKSVAVFGSVERKGSWTVPRELKVVAVFGSTVLDFREARLAPGITEVRIAAVFGSVEIIVPPDLPIDTGGVAVMGSFEHMDRAPDTVDPARPTVRVTGTAVFGSVEVKTRLPGESAWQAHKRRRAERRAQRHLRS